MHFLSPKKTNRRAPPHHSDDDDDDYERKPSGGGASVASPMLALRSLFLSPKDKARNLSGASPLRSKARRSPRLTASSATFNLGIGGAGESGSMLLLNRDVTKQATTLRQIMDHEVWGPQFRKFAKAQRADEGIQFLDALAHHSTTSTTPPTAAAKQLMDTFIVDSAPKCINLSSRTRSALLEQHGTHQYTSLHSLFMPVVYEVFADIKQSETFRLFCQSEDDVQRFCEDADTMLLDAVVVLENFPKMRAFLHGDVVMENLVRFCCSVAEFEALCAEEGKRVESTALKNKIAATFVQSGARLQLDNLPKLYVDAILSPETNREHVLSDARIEALQILGLDHQFVQQCRSLLQ